MSMHLITKHCVGVKRIKMVEILDSQEIMTKKQIMLNFTGEKKKHENHFS